MKLCGYEVGNDRPFFLIAGPCVIESEALVIDVAGRLQARSRGELGIPYIFKASFDKANRSSRASFRGPGIEQGLKILERVRAQIGVPVLTDVHEDTPLAEVAAVVDVLQTPAFLCRQTNFIVNAASQGKPVNIKKGQFLSPWEMRNVVDKARSTGNEQIMVCERGFTFGYNNLVSDMRSLSVMRDTGCPVVFDATHSVQLPGGQGDASGGQREFVPVLARAAVAAGVAGVFMETHPDPANALSDGPNAWPLDRMASLLGMLVDLDAAVKTRPFEEVEPMTPDHRHHGPARSSTRAAIPPSRPTCAGWRRDRAARPCLRARRPDARGGGAARRRQDALSRQGRAQGRRERQRRHTRGAARPRRARPGGHRRSDDRARRHRQQVAARRQRAAGGVARGRARRGAHAQAEPVSARLGGAGPKP